MQCLIASSPVPFRDSRGVCVCVCVCVCVLVSVSVFCFIVLKLRDPWAQLLVHKHSCVCRNQQNCSGQQKRAGAEERRPTETRVWTQSANQCEPGQLKACQYLLEAAGHRGSSLVQMMKLQNFPMTNAKYDKRLLCWASSPKRITSCRLRV